MQKTLQFLHNQHQRACLPHQIFGVSDKYLQRIFSLNQTMEELYHACLQRQPTYDLDLANHNTLYGEQPLNQNPKHRALHPLLVNRNGTSYRAPIHQF